MPMPRHVADAGLGARSWAGNDSGLGMRKWADRLQSGFNWQWLHSVVDRRISAASTDTPSRWHAITIAARRSPGAAICRYLCAMRIASASSRTWLRSPSAWTSRPSSTATLS